MLIRQEGFGSDPSEDSTGVAYENFISKFLKTLGFTTSASTKDVALEGHLSLASGKALRLKEGSNATSGVAVLVAGTKTVATTSVKTGDRVILTRQLTGGTVGHLTLGTIVNNTSFVIDSSSSSDTSTIYWVIVRPAA